MSVTPSKSCTSPVMPLLKRKTFKKIRYYNIMLVGESCIGKKTFISSIFDHSDLSKANYSEEDISSFLSKDDMSKNLHIRIASNCYEMDINSQKFRLKVVNTKYFGDSIDQTLTYVPIINFIDKQLDDFLKDESSLERRNLHDNRIHCLVYFINPNKVKLNVFDLDFLKKVQTRVNIIPIIAKSDILSPQEILLRKTNVRQQLSDNNICIYPFPDDSAFEDDDPLTLFSSVLKESVPFAISASTFKQSFPGSAGRKVYARQYPWGVYNIENKELCDYMIARSMLTNTHVDDFIDTTCDIYYENYRTERLRGEKTLS